MSKTSKEETKTARFLREFGDQLGKIPDRELAAKAGYIHEATVNSIRTNLNIPSVPRGVSWILARDEPGILTEDYRVLMARHNVSDSVIWRARKIAKGLSTSKKKPSPLDGQLSLVDNGIALHKDTLDDVSLRPVTFWERIVAPVRNFFRRIFKMSSVV